MANPFGDFGASDMSSNAAYNSPFASAMGDMGYRRKQMTIAPVPEAAPEEVRSKMAQAQAAAVQMQQQQQSEPSPDRTFVGDWIAEYGRSRARGLFSKAQTAVAENVFDPELRRNLQGQILEWSNQFQKMEEKDPIEADKFIKQVFLATASEDVVKSIAWEAGKEVLIQAGLWATGAAEASGGLASGASLYRSGKSIKAIWDMYRAGQATRKAVNIATTAKAASALGSAYINWNIWGRSIKGDIQTRLLQQNPGIDHDLLDHASTMSGLLGAGIFSLGVPKSMKEFLMPAAREALGEGAKLGIMNSFKAFGKSSGKLVGAMTASEMANVWQSNMAVKGQLLRDIERGVIDATDAKINTDPRYTTIEGWDLVQHAWNTAKESIPAALGFGAISGIARGYGEARAVVAKNVKERLEAERRVAEEKEQTVVDVKAYHEKLNKASEDIRKRFTFEEHQLAAMGKEQFNEIKDEINKMWRDATGEDIDRIKTKNDLYELNGTDAETAANALELYSIQQSGRAHEKMQGHIAEAIDAAESAGIDWQTDSDFKKRLKSELREIAKAHGVEAKEASLDNFIQTIDYDKRVAKEEAGLGRFAPPQGSHEYASWAKDIADKYNTKRIAKGLEPVAGPYKRAQLIKMARVLAGDIRDTKAGKKAAVKKVVPAAAVVAENSATTNVKTEANASAPKQPKTTKKPKVEPLKTIKIQKPDGSHVAVDVKQGAEVHIANGKKGITTPYVLTGKATDKTVEIHRVKVDSEGVVLDKDGKPQIDTTVAPRFIRASELEFTGRTDPKGASVSISTAGGVREELTGAGDKGKQSAKQQESSDKRIEKIAKDKDQRESLSKVIDGLVESNELKPEEVAEVLDSIEKLQRADKFTGGGGMAFVDYIINQLKGKDGPESVIVDADKLTSKVKSKLSAQDRASALTNAIKKAYDGSQTRPRFIFDPEDKSKKISLTDAAREIDELKKKASAEERAKYSRTSNTSGGEIAYVKSEDTGQAAAKEAHKDAVKRDESAEEQAAEMRAGESRNGYSADVESQHQHAIRSDAFKRDFGDWEKIPLEERKRDPRFNRETGEPQLYEHYTEADGIKKFELSKLGETSGDYGYRGAGYYFSKYGKGSKIYGPNRLLFYLKPRNSIHENSRTTFSEIMPRGVAEGAPAYGFAIRKAARERGVGGVFVGNEATVYSSHDVIAADKFATNDKSQQRNSAGVARAEKLNAEKHTLTRLLSDISSNQSAPYMYRRLASLLSKMPGTENISVEYIYSSNEAAGRYSHDRKSVMVNLFHAEAKELGENIDSVIKLHEAIHAASLAQIKLALVNERVLTPLQMDGFNELRSLYEKHGEALASKLDSVGLTAQAGQVRSGVVEFISHALATPEAFGFLSEIKTDGTVKRVMIAVMRGIAKVLGIGNGSSLIRTLDEIVERGTAARSTLESLVKLGSSKSEFDLKKWRELDANMLVPGRSSVSSGKDVADRLATSPNERIGIRSLAEKDDKTFSRMKLFDITTELAARGIKVDLSGANTRLDMIDRIFGTEKHYPDWAVSDYHVDIKNDNVGTFKDGSMLHHATSSMVKAHQNAVTAFYRLGEKVGKWFDEGMVKAAQKRGEADQHVIPITEKIKTVATKLVNDKIDTVINGERHTISHAERISATLHSLDKETSELISKNGWFTKEGKHITFGKTKEEQAAGWKKFVGEVAYKPGSEGYEIVKRILEITKYLGDRIGPIAENYFGKDFKQVQNYFTRFAFHEPEAKGQIKEGFDRFGNWGRTEERVTHGRPIKLTDAYEVMFQMIMESTHFIGHAPLVKEARSIISNPSISSAVINKFGGQDKGMKYFRSLENFLNIIEGKIPQDNIPWLNKFLRYQDVARFSNPFTALKQFASTANIPILFSFRDWFLSLRALDDKHIEKILNSPGGGYMWHRMRAQQSAPEIRENYLEHGARQMFGSESALDKVRRLSTSAISMADKYTIKQTLTAAYHYVKRMNPTWSEEAVNIEVNRAASDALLRLQPVGEPGWKAEIAANNPWGRLWTRYQHVPLALFNETLRAHMNLLRHPSRPRENLQFFKTVMFGTLASGAVLASVDLAKQSYYKMLAGSYGTQGKDEDPQKLAKRIATSLAMSSMEQLPGARNFSTIIQPFMEAFAAGDPSIMAAAERRVGQDPAMGSFFKNAYSVLEGIVQLKKSQDMSKIRTNKQYKQHMEARGRQADRATRALLDLISETMGVPLGSVNRMTGLSNLLR